METRSNRHKKSDAKSRWNKFLNKIRTACITQHQISVKIMAQNTIGEERCGIARATGLGASFLPSMELGAHRRRRFCQKLQSLDGATREQEGGCEDEDSGARGSSATLPLGRTARRRRNPWPTGWPCTTSPLGSGTARPSRALLHGAVGARPRRILVILVHKEEPLLLPHLRHACSQINDCPYQHQIESQQSMTYRYNKSISNTNS
jgi:hypothetical protein